MVRESVYKAALEEHNKYRRMHGVPEVTDDPALHREAQEWAEYLAKNDQFFHSTGRQKHMENLAGALGSTEEEGIRYAYKMWYDEIKSFDFNRGGFSMQTGHFTAMVWKSLRTIGIGICFNPRKRWWVIANKFGEVVNMQGEFRQKVPRPLGAAEFKKNEEARMKQLSAEMEKVTVADESEEDGSDSGEGEESEEESTQEKPKPKEEGAKKDGGPTRLAWVSRGNGKADEFAVKGGNLDGNDVYVARVQYGSGKIPGRLVKGQKTAGGSYGGGEVALTNYEVLVAPPKAVKWVTASSEIDPNTVPGGLDPSGEPYFIGRVNHDGALICGKVHRGICFIAHGGREVGFREFEILVRS